MIRMPTPVTGAQLVLYYTVIIILFYYIILISNMWLAGLDLVPSTKAFNMLLNQ